MNRCVTLRARGEGAHLPRAVRGLHSARAALTAALDDAPSARPLARAYRAALASVDDALDRLDAVRFTQGRAA